MDKSCISLLITIKVSASHFVLTEPKTLHTGLLAVHPTEEVSPHTLPSVWVLTKIKIKKGSLYQKLK